MPTNCQHDFTDLLLFDNVGAFYVNVDNNETLTRNMVATFTLHEASPGHHLQYVVNSKSDMPDFLRHPHEGHGMPAAFPRYEAYKEGWGLYSEHLGHDLGVYKNEPRKELGQLNGALLRAARLVVDTGNKNKQQFDRMLLILVFRNPLLWLVEVKGCGLYQGQYAVRSGIGRGRS